MSSRRLKLATLSIVLPLLAGCTFTTYPTDFSSGDDGDGRAGGTSFRGARSAGAVGKGVGAALNVATNMAINDELDKADAKSFAANKKLKQNPNDAKALVERGYAAYVNMQLDEALSDYTAAIAIAPNDADIYRKRADVYEMKEQLELAKKDRETAKKISGSWW